MLKCPFKPHEIVLCDFQFNAWLYTKGQDGIDGYGPSGPKGDKVPVLYIHTFTENSEKRKIAYEYLLFSLSVFRDISCCFLSFETYYDLYYNNIKHKKHE